MALAEICQMEQLMLTNNWFILLSFNVLTKELLTTSLKHCVPQCEVVSAKDACCVLFANTTPGLSHPESPAQVLPVLLLAAPFSEFKQLLHSFTPQ